MSSPDEPQFKSASLEDWQRAAAKSAPGGNVDALNWTTSEGIVVKPLYTKQDVKDLPYADTLPGWPLQGARTLIATATGLDVTIENDVNLAALAERAAGWILDAAQLS